MATRRRPTAGLFDIRFIIALLLGIYGVVLVVMGTLTSSGRSTASDGLNVNLWTGLALVATAAVMALWGRLRPIVIETDDQD